jgi:hypothetical protein
MSGTLLVISLIIAVSSALICVHNLLQLRRLTRQLNQERQQFVQRLEMINKGAMGIGKRLLAMEQESRHHEPASDSAKPASTATTDYLPYSQAIKLFQQGASTEEVVERCHLSRAEADLMSLVHHQSSEAER